MLVRKIGFHSSPEEYIEYFRTLDTPILELLACQAAYIGNVNVLDCLLNDATIPNKVDIHCRKDDILKHAYRKRRTNVIEYLVVSQSLKKTQDIEVFLFNNKVLAEEMHDAQEKDRFYKVVEHLFEMRNLNNKLNDGLEDKKEHVNNRNKL